MKKKIKVSDVPLSIPNAQGRVGQRQPRSIMDKLLGKSTVQYSRAVPTINTARQGTNNFRRVGPKPVNKKDGKTIYGGKGWGP